MKHNDQKIISRISSGYNYGVQGGYGDLMIVDADDTDILNAFSIFGDTFTVKTGNGTHLYFYAPGLKKSYALFKETPESDETNIQTKNVGHITFFGRMVVGPNCPHYDFIEEKQCYVKSGKNYIVTKDIPIKVITGEQVLATIKRFTADSIKEKYKVQNDARKNDSMNRMEIPIDLVASKMSGLQPKSPGYRGHNPDHPQSKSKMDLTIDTNKNWWLCSACCQSGAGFGNALYLIALNEGILRCHECKAGGLRGEKFLQVKKLAIEKYGISEEYFGLQWIQDEPQIQIKIDDERKVILKTNNGITTLSDGKETFFTISTKKNNDWMASEYYTSRLKKSIENHYNIKEEESKKIINEISNEALKMNRNEKKTKNNFTDPKKLIENISKVEVVLSEDFNVYMITIEGEVLQLKDEELVDGPHPFQKRYMNKFLKLTKIANDDWYDIILPAILEKAKETRENDKETRMESNSELVVGLFVSYVKSRPIFDWDDQKKRSQYTNASFFDKETGLLRVSTEFVREFLQTENVKLRYGVTKEQFDAALRIGQYMPRKRITGKVGETEKTFRLFDPEKFNISEKNVHKTEELQKISLLGNPALDAYEADKDGDKE